jgi:hypothetical protein
MATSSFLVVWNSSREITSPVPDAIPVDSLNKKPVR